MTAKQPTLFTPGPLTTSQAVKDAMQRDYGSRDADFMDCVKYIRSTMLEVAGLDPKEWCCVLLQGPGTFSIEAAITTTTPPAAQGGRYLVIQTGKYAERQYVTAKRIGIDVVCYNVAEGEEVDMAGLEAFLKAEGQTFTNVGFVHHETSTGMVNPCAEMARLVRAHCRPSTTIVIDSISAFGGFEIDVPATCDVLLTSSNKCLHGVPGFGIVLMRRSKLASCKGFSRSYVLDLCFQAGKLDKTGQFPFTPPIHVLMAFQAALKQFVEEGGVRGRQATYKAYSRRVQQRMTALGFRLFLDPEAASFGHIVVAFNMPKHPKWNFKAFYKALREEGCVIYPGKASNAETFRFGLIGTLTPADIERILDASERFVKDPANGITDLAAHGYHNSDRSWRTRKLSKL